MPRIPKIQNLNANSADILNTIRENASPEYRAMIGEADVRQVASLRAIGDVMMQYQPLQNEFLTALVNRIGLVIITSKLYENPWAFFKRGILEYGETVEEIFVSIAKPHQFNQDRAEKEVFKREIPNVLAAFHSMNYQKFYKTTVSNDQLRQAFLSWDGITDLIGRIIDSLYTGANYDEFLVMKYLIAVHILNGNIGSVTIPAINDTNMRQVTSVLKSQSNLLTFMSSAWNMAAVPTYTDKRDQFLIVNSRFDALMDVEVLATSFNMDKAEFMGHRVLVDSFGSLDISRLNELFKEQPGGYHQFTSEELTALDTIPAVLVSRDWFMIFDNFYNMTQQYNGEGLYWNYWLHTWKTFSVSPYGQAMLFNPETPSITSIAVSPTAVTVMKGQNAYFTANVEGTNFAPNSVTWEVNSELSSINSAGMLYVPLSETASTLTVKATSTFDTTKTATATVTVQSINTPDEETKTDTATVTIQNVNTSDEGIAK